MKLTQQAFLSLALASSLLTACDQDDDDSSSVAPTVVENSSNAAPGQPADVVAAAAGNADLSVLLGLVSQYPDLVEGLKSGDLTVFAPTNQAFADVDTSSLSAAQIKTILQYHVVKVDGSDGILSTELSAEQAAPSLTQEALFVTKDAAGVSVNAGAQVIAADVTTANGSVVHVIDQVLLPDAFGTIVDAVVKRYELSALKDAVLAQGLAEALAAPTPGKTVFAPTNQAFAALGTAAPSGEALTSVLLYHVLASPVLSTDIVGPLAPATLSEGRTLKVKREGETVVLGDSTTTPAQVVTADIVTSNGVIHVIDKVLIP